MSEVIPVSVTSVKVVQVELNVSLQKAARHFEAFISDRSAVDQLNESLQALTDVVGIIKMLQLPGIGQLTEEMVNLLNQMIATPDKTSDFALSALSHGFVATPCYIEYIVDREQAVPALMLPFINEIRSALRQPIIFESQHAGFTATVTQLVDAQAVADNDINALAKRMRQLFQTALIGLIRDENVDLKLQLMHRASSRMAKSIGSSQNRTQFRLLEAVLEAMMSGKLALNFTRKRSLALMDSEFRKVASEGVTEESNANTELLQELIYLISLSNVQHPASQEAISTCAIQPQQVTDSILQKERAIMQGPNAETIVTMVQALREELAQSKETLEIAAQDVGGTADFSNLVALFQRTSDILAVVGLKTPAQILGDLKIKTQSWSEGEQYDRDGLLSVADGLIYIESVLASLSRLDLNFEDSESDDDTKMRLMMKSQLDEAETIVIQEAQAGIVQSKKDITSYIESNYDNAHINNVSDNLKSVLGGLKILKLNEAAAVLESSIRFVENIIANGVEEDKAQSVLETMADALIALEYYLSEMELHSVAPPNVLQVAEQSLASLGYPVNSSV